MVLHPRPQLALFAILLGILFGALSPELAKADTVTYRIKVQPHVSRTVTTKAVFPEVFDWSATIAGDPVMAELVLPAETWVYGYGVSVRVSRTSRGHLRFRTYNAADRTRTFVARIKR